MKLRFGEFWWRLSLQLCTAIQYLKRFNLNISRVLLRQFFIPFKCFFLFLKLLFFFSRLEFFFLSDVATVEIERYIYFFLLYIIIKPFYLSFLTLSYFWHCFYEQLIKERFVGLNIIQCLNIFFNSNIYFLCL